MVLYCHDFDLIKVKAVHITKHNITCLFPGIIKYEEEYLIPTKVSEAGTCRQNYTKTGVRSQIYGIAPDPLGKWEPPPQIVATASFPWSTFVPSFAHLPLKYHWTNKELPKIYQQDIWIAALPWGKFPHSFTMVNSNIGNFLLIQRQLQRQVEHK